MLRLSDVGDLLISEQMSFVWAHKLCIGVIGFCKCSGVLCGQRVMRFLTVLVLACLILLESVRCDSNLFEGHVSEMFKELFESIEEFALLAAVLQRVNLYNVLCGSRLFNTNITSVCDSIFRHSFLE